MFTGSFRDTVLERRNKEAAEERVAWQRALAGG
jgi:hypothetical protein